MEQEIHSASEAFCQEGMCWYIGMKVRNGKATIDKIVKESVYDTGDPYDFYVGYDTTGNRVFQIRVSAATVTFK